MLRILIWVGETLLQLFHRPPYKELPPMPRYRFCESSLASSTSLWHIRPLTEAGSKYGGGIDTPSLCGHVVPTNQVNAQGKQGWGGWDLEVQISERQLDTNVCPKCVALYREATGGPK
jgi:hypothetical protein